jgi:thiamine-monophosphate kinase
MNATTSDDRGERALVRRLRALLAGGADGPSAVPFGDDMASIESGAERLLWTVDMLQEGVDFDAGTHGWGAIGRKAMAVNLSDCAAMAVEPVAALAAVALSGKLSMDDALELFRGAHACGLEYGCSIVGGDTNSWDGPTVISITVAARVPAGRAPIRRDGARPGDRIWVSGPVGGSILGRHLTFEPRVPLALEVARELHPHALIDISDGLILDLSRIAEASGCGAVLWPAALEAAIHPDAVRLSERDGVTPREHALYDGEDFELIVVLAADADTVRCGELGLLPIGEIQARAGIWLDGPDSGAPIEVRGWEHFR